MICYKDRQLLGGMIMRLAICDDDRPFLREMEQRLTGYPFIKQVVQYTRPDDLFQDLEEKARFDAVLMDIDLGGGPNGIEYARRLYRKAPHLPVIYVTGYNDRYAQRILLEETNLVGYLTKPVEEWLLLRYLNKVLDRRTAAVKLMFRQQGSLLALAADQIVYLESNDHVTVIHTPETSYTVYEKLSDIIPRLPEAFVRCHKSYAANMRCIRRLEAGKLLLENGVELRISRSFSTSTKETVFRYLSRQV